MTCSEAPQNPHYYRKQGSNKNVTIAKLCIQVTQYCMFNLFKNKSRGVVEHNNIKT